MIKQLTLQKFQSWNKQTVDFAPITVIVGKGNTGKSALLRAMKYALSNRGGDDFIRYGANTAKVGLVFDDDTAVLWTKERGSGGRYWLYDGEGEQEFSKTGTTVPDAISGATGIRPLEVEKGSFIWPQLRLQFDGPFLLPESGTRIARILGKLTKLDVLVNAQMQVRRERDAMRREVEVAEKRYSITQDKLRALPDLVKARELYAEAEEAVEYAQETSLRTAAAHKAAAQIHTHNTLQRQELTAFVFAVDAYNTLAWRARRARATAADYYSCLDRYELAQELVEKAEEGCCK